MQEKKSSGKMFQWSLEYMLRNLSKKPEEESNPHSLYASPLAFLFLFPSKKTVLVE